MPSFSFLTKNCQISETYWYRNKFSLFPPVYILKIKVLSSSLNSNVHHTWKKLRTLELSDWSVSSLVMGCSLKALFTNEWELFLARFTLDGIPSPTERRFLGWGDWAPVGDIIGLLLIPFRRGPISGTLSACLCQKSILNIKWLVYIVWANASPRDASGWFMNVENLIWFDSNQSLFFLSHIKLSNRRLSKFIYSK